MASKKGNHTNNLRFISTTYNYSCISINSK